MDYRKLTLCLVLSGSLAGFGCGGDDEPEGPGMTRTYVVSALDVGQADPAGDPDVVPGFNLDNRVSDMDDAQGCFQLDYKSPPPDNEDGVDNQLGPILSSLGSSFDIAGTIAENIADGSLLILVTVEDIHDFTNDSQVTVKLELGTLEGTGATAPELDAMGNLAANQTINVNVASVGLVEIPDGRIVNGRLQAGPVDLMLDLPVQGMTLTLNIRTAQLRFDIMDASFDTGVLGGELDIDETVAAVAMVAGDSVPETLVRSVLEGQADLQPDAAGDCQAVSVGLVLDGTVATRGEEVTVP